jgi:hypothetical protein
MLPLNPWLGQRMQFDRLKRREFITLLGGAAAAWPLTARAQQAERVRLIGVLMNITADDLPQRANIAAFQQVMAQSGWTDGRNVKIDVRWSGGDVVRLRKRCGRAARPPPRCNRRWFRSDRGSIATADPHGADRIHDGR